MDKVIETLYSIEERANKIMETTSNEKISLKADNDAKKAEYEAMVTKKTNETLASLRESIKKHYEDELAETKLATKKAIDELTTYYEQNHTSIAKDLFNKITEV